MSNYNSETEFTAEENKWFKQLDGYRQARVEEIYWELMRAKRGSQGAMDLIEDIAGLETQIINWNHATSEMMGEHDVAKNEDFKDRLFSDTYGETNAESEAYKKYIEPFE